MSEEWGPWIDHDGKGCPCLGEYVRVVKFNGDVVEAIAGSQLARAGFSISDTIWSAWVWNYPKPGGVKTYRIRKPRGMKVLETILAEIPSTPEKVGA